MTKVDFAKGAMEGSTKPRPRTYRRGEIVPFEEDLRHEFKGHRTISIENRTRTVQMVGDIEVEEYSQTRQHWSKYLCGMLNSSGGILYGAVQDDGTVAGFMMSEYQKDHVIVQLEDLFERFYPPVSKEQYSVRFVPVVDEEYEADPVECDPELKGLEHMLRSTNRCWCDEESAASYEFGEMKITSVQCSNLSYLQECYCRST